MISVVIPVYNRPKELSRALSSLSKQTCNEFEVVVCDDGSDEDIVSVVEQFKQKLDIKYIRIENSGGPARPRNIAIMASKYDWISFLDSDDWCSDDKISEIIHAIESNPDYDVFYHKLKVIGKERKRLWWSTDKVGKRIGKNSFVHLMTHGNCLPNSAVTISRKAFADVGKIIESNEYAAVEDYDYWLKLAKNNYKFYFINKILGYYWYGADGISSDPVKHTEKVNLIFNKYLKYLDGINKAAAISQHYYQLANLQLAASNYSIAYNYLVKAKDLSGIKFKYVRMMKMLFIRFKLALI